MRDRSSFRKVPFAAITGMAWSETTTTSYWSPALATLLIISSVLSYVSSTIFMPVSFWNRSTSAGSMYSEYMKTVTVLPAGGRDAFVPPAAPDWFLLHAERRTQHAAKMVSVVRIDYSSLGLRVKSCRPSTSVTVTRKTMVESAWMSGETPRRSEP